MTVWFFLPLLVAIAAALGSRLVQSRLDPVIGTWLLTGLAAGSAVTVFGAVALVSLTYVAGVAWIADRVGWCRTLAAANHAPNTVVGLVSLTLTVCAVVRGWRVLHRHHQIARGPATEEVVIVESADVVAYAVPGRPGHVVVSTAMLKALSSDEQSVMFAHESAHLAYRHHRFVLVGSVAAAVLPVLRPLARQIVFSTERWADEVAAAHVGDRVLAAQAIATAAFAASSPAFALGLADLGVVGRVDALLNDRAPTKVAGRFGGATGCALAVVCLGGGIVQLLHVASLVLHICAG